MNKKEINELFLDDLGYGNKKEFLMHLGELFRIIGEDGMDEILPTEIKQVKKNLLKYFDTLLLSEKEYVNEMFGVFKRLPVIKPTPFSHIWIVLPSGDVITTNCKHDYLGEALPFRVSPWTPSAKAQAKYDKLVKKYENSSAVDMAEIKENEKFAKETTLDSKDVKRYSLFLFWQLRQAEDKKMLKPVYTGAPLSKLLQEEDAAATACSEYSEKKCEEDCRLLHMDATLKQLVKIRDSKERASDEYYETWVKYQLSTREYYEAYRRLFDDEYIIKEGQEEKFRQAFNAALAEYLAFRDRINSKQGCWRKLGWSKNTFISYLLRYRSKEILQDMDDFFYTDKQKAEYMPQAEIIQDAVDAMRDMLQPISKQDISSFISGAAANIPDIVKEYLYYMRAVERPAKKEVA